MYIQLLFNRVQIAIYEISQSDNGITYPERSKMQYLNTGLRYPFKHRIPHLSLCILKMGVVANKILSNHRILID